MEENYVEILKESQFQVSVNIWEARHLTLKFRRVKGVVQIGKQKKTFRPKTRNTDSPFINFYCVFNFNIHLTELVEKVLILTIFDIPRCILRRKRLVGLCRVDLGTIWTQPNHQFHRKWAVLTDPTDPTGAVKGYVQCDLCILVEGSKMKQIDVTGDKIKGNILVPDGAEKERQRARYLVTVYWGQTLKSRYCGFNQEKEEVKISPTVAVSFGEVVGVTWPMTNVSDPIWMEQIEFLDIYPPLFQRIYIKLYDANIKKHLNPVAVHAIDLRNICFEGITGFLPTFGPSYIHFYGPCDTENILKNKRMRILSYKGRLLVSVETELVDPGEEMMMHTKQGVVKKKAEKPILNWTEEEHVLIAVIYDLLFFGNSLPRKPVDVKITMGARPSLSKKKEIPSPPERTVVSALKRYYLPTHSYVQFVKQFPVLQSQVVWSDLRRRVYLENFINKILQYTDECIERIIRLESLSKFDVAKIKCEEYVKQVMTKAQLLNKYLQTFMKETNRLDFLKVKTLISLLKIFIDNKDMKKQPKSMHYNLRILVQFSNILQRFSKNPQTPYPNLEIWFLMDGHPVTHNMINTRDILYSSDEYEKGRDCGRIQTVLIKTIDKHICAKLEVFLWFGLKSQWPSCVESIPPGYQIELEVDQIPLKLTYSETHVFQCRIHIFSGRLKPGMDVSGLADPFVRVTIEERTKSTRVIEKTLNPIWDETLIFSNVVYYISGQRVKENPTSIAFEVFDKDRNEDELIGRGTITPVVQLADELYEEPDFPPKLTWIKVSTIDGSLGELLMAAELLEVPLTQVKLHYDQKELFLPMPRSIRPVMATFRLEVLFWGLRKYQNMKWSRFFVELQCMDQKLRSTTINRLHKFPNFTSQQLLMHLTLPVNEEYAPPITIKLYKQKTCKRMSLVGSTIIYSITDYLCPLFTMKERKNISREKILKFDAKITGTSININCTQLLKTFLAKCSHSIWQLCISSPRPQIDNELTDLNEYFEADWWMRYFASKGNTERKEHPTFKVYDEELEVQPEFNGFKDMLRVFALVKGKKRIKFTSVLKAAMKLYLWPKPDLESLTEDGWDPDNKLLSRMPENKRQAVTVRVYIVRAYNLQPKDLSGLADPYLKVALGKKEYNEKKNYIPKDLNPVFGKCFEFHTSFPRSCCLKIKIMDRDSMSKADLIGETELDLENRYYSRHRARCGLQQKYETTGYNKWRDCMLPSQILETLCIDLELPSPLYHKYGVEIGEFLFQIFEDPSDQWKEIVSLEVLNRWHEYPIKGFHLVAEHIETRSLYNPAKYNIEQGKLELWVDMFSTEPAKLPPMINISPRGGLDLELRVIVWETKNTKLKEHSYLFGEDMSDIYICGWLDAQGSVQSTDVHYHSTTGEGLFNWRFVYQFQYHWEEQKMLLIHDKIKEKIPCHLELQAWDNNTFTSDAFIGALTLNLASMPRGTKLAKTCNLSLLKEDTPTVNLFKLRRMNGWWPFRHVIYTEHADQDYELTGKVNLEFEILTLEEAAQRPAGKGRDPPDELPAPNRPKISFNWFLNPIRTLRYVVLSHFKMYCGFICCGLVILIMVASILYSFPEYVIKFLLGV